MAANRFSTMIHSNTNKFTFVLIYAVLEWTLILLLLLNSLFTFLIIKFSQLFALKSPCPWCSTLHRFFEPQNINTHRDLLCEFHSKEVSVLGFCPNHKKLAEITDLCEDCFSSHLGFQSEVKQSDGEDEDEHNLKCSCCGMKFRKKSVDDFLLARNSYNGLGDSEKGDLVMGVERKIGSNDGLERLINGDGKDVWNSNSFEMETGLNQFEKRGDSTSDFLPQDLEFFFDFSGNQLVPIELVDSTTEESQNISEADEDRDFGDYQKAHMIQELHKKGLESMKLEEAENSLVFHAKIGESSDENSAIVEQTRALFIDTKELQETVVETVTLDPNTHSVQEEAKASIETEIPALESCVEEPSANSLDLHSKIENGLRSKNLSENHNGIDNDKIPNTPSSIKKLWMLERKETRVEESLDGSVMSELDNGDPINATEKLKSALHALKAELEEERSASAVAASETMAMITRLQEEKAAMQMEALQYQRMMEEQSEYDQEALQLLNELMIKKEKELETYRRKVADYESKDPLRFYQGTSSASSSHSEDGNGNQESWNRNPIAPDNTVLELDSSLADFEEERLSIFEQIKVLEEKLFALSDDEDQQFADVRPIEDSYLENGFHSNNKVTESKEFDSNELDNGKKRSEIEEEVDQVYGRLQALEADREFLKHCIGSLKKGDKGMELLQEILQHLRDLRTMDL